MSSEITKQEYDRGIFIVVAFLHSDFVENPMYWVLDDRSITTQPPFVILNKLLRDLRGPKGFKISVICPGQAIKITQDIRCNTSSLEHLTMSLQSPKIFTVTTHNITISNKKFAAIAHNIQHDTSLQHKEKCKNSVLRSNSKKII